jgi:hypothetical protein
MKTCTGCKEEKPLTDFSSNGKYIRSRCKPCNAAQARRWAAENKERALETQRRRTLPQTYGITYEEYEQMLADQNGVCAICGKDEPNEHGRTGKKFRLSVDHCHDTGVVRGLLCQKCNRALGLLNDSPELLQSAIDYLLRHHANAANGGGK